MSEEKRFTVWVGGLEINDYLLTAREAERVAEHWREKGYNDVEIEMLGN